MTDPKQLPLSVILITKNEAHNLHDCLTSLHWADEIIVVDSGSSDGSQDICREFGCTLIETDWPGFGPQKNRALQLATHQWVLSIDADERITDQLRSDIIQAINTDDDISGYYMPRSSSYCGRFIKHSGWYPDYILRLFQREKARFSDDKVHEKIIITGKTAKLTNHLIHYSFSDLEQVLGKVNQYSSLGAEQLYKQGKRSTITKAIGKGIWSFLRSYIFRRGFLDRQEGLMLAISNAEGTYYKYAKLALLCKQQDPLKR